MEKNKRKIHRTIFLIILSMIMCYPLFYTISSSFMETNELINYQSSNNSLFHLIPDFFSFSQYEVLLLKEPKYLLMFWNTIGMTVIITLGQIIISVLGGYSLSKFVFRGRDTLLFTYIIIMIMPLQVTLVPQYIVINQLHLYGSIWAVILPVMFNPFGVFLIAQFMKSIPGDLLEVAELEGASRIQTLTNIIIPLTKGGIVALMVLTIIECWNMIEQPLIFLKEAKDYPLSLFLAWIRPDGNSGLVCAASVLFMLPILFIFLYTREDLIEGISYSCIKG